MKTYPFLKLLTDEEVERMFDRRWRTVTDADSRLAMLRTRDEDGRPMCPLGAARLPDRDAGRRMPGPLAVARLLAARQTELSLTDLCDQVHTFMYDVDEGRLPARSLRSVVRRSREG